MPSLNQMMIIGNVGSEPEMRYTPNGKPVTSFSVATNWKYTTAEGERKDETEWFTVVAWGKLAETCNQYVTKGMLVYADGRLRIHKWEGNDGQQHQRTEIVASKVTFLSRSESKPQELKSEEDIEPEDIPF